MQSRSFLSAGALVLPALFLFTGSRAGQPLVSSGDLWQYRKGTNAPQTNWQSVAGAALDSTWATGPGGFGFADNAPETQLCQTLLPDMLNGYTTLYLRRSFEVTSPANSSLHLELTMDWDDGFVAYLDGVEVQRSQARTAVDVEPPFSDTASGNHESSRGSSGAAPTRFDLGPVATLLQPGIHVLAILGLNSSAGSSDFIQIADLALVAPPVPALVAAGGTWRYRKGTNAPPANWQSVADAALDSTWLSGPGGFGYSDGDDATELTDMRNAYTTVYIRRTFIVTNTPEASLHALLEMDWDDGFVAYLDGSEVARALAPGAVDTEPTWSDAATGDHEASRGNNSPQPAVTYDLGQAAPLLPPGTHILAILGLNQPIDSSDFSLIASLRLGIPPPPPPGTITTDTNWTAAASPYVLAGDLTIATGATLTIEPGVTVLLDAGATIHVNGRLLAEGTAENRIRFARHAAGNWTRIDFGANAAESRISQADIDGGGTGGASVIRGNGTTLYLAHLVWTNTTAQLLDLANSSITLLSSRLPSIQNNELIHFNGMPATGHALIASNLFGTPGLPTTSGYNDIIDFTGGNRPGPIVEFIGNIFLSGVDDVFDMDGTDAHIEGNVFMNVFQDAPRASSSHPVTSGAAGGNTSELFVCRNLFYNCEHALLLKDGGTAVMQNNTIVHLATNANARTSSTGMFIPPGIVFWGESWRGDPPGDGLLFEGSIAYDLDPAVLANPFPYFDPAASFMDIRYSLIQGTNWPGMGNLNADPRFVSLTGITHETIRSHLALLPDSPCRGTGPNGLDMGALVPAGASVSGTPPSPTRETNATLRVAGPGLVAYRWKLNDGLWSAPVQLTNSLVITPGLFLTNNMIVSLSGLVDGAYTFSAVGQNSAGRWQDTNAAAIVSWVVRTQPELRIVDVIHTNGGVTLRFEADAGKSYSVLRSDTLSPALWTKLTDVDAVAESGLAEVSDQGVNGKPTSFYRLVSPKQP